MNNIRSLLQLPSVHITGIVILAVCLHLPTLGFEFTNWDDDIHVTNNPLIQHFSVSNLFQQCFPTTKYMYHPVTIISYMVDWNLAGGKPWMFHATNVLLHGANVLLLYFLLKGFRLSVGMRAFITLLFAVHPLQVESVSWISARKELLYAFFYLTSLLMYQCYRGKTDKKLLLVSLICFVLSLLSKPAAITLPVVVVALEYIRIGRFSKEIISTAVLFFIIAIFYLVLFMQTQQSALTPPITYYSVAQRSIMIVYSFSFYLWKFIFPFSLSACYAYPDVNALSAKYYLLSLFSIILFIVAYHYSVERKKMLFGLLLYALTIVPVLQLMPFHNASLVADRYVYLPIIGLALCVGHAVHVGHGYQQHDSLTLTAKKFVALFLLIVVIAASLNRVFVWKDSITLFTDVIEKDPSLAIAYGNRGNAKLLQGDYAGAINDCNMVLRFNPYDGKAYYNIGNAYSQLAKFDSAIYCYDKAIDFGYSNYTVWYNRGNAHFNIGNHDSAVADYSRSLSYSLRKPEIYFNIGYVYLLGKQNYSMAKLYFDTALVINPDLIEAYYFRAECYYKLKQYGKAFSDLTIANSFNNKVSKTALYAKVVTMLQHLNRSIDSLSIIVQKHPDNYASLKSRAELYLQLNDSLGYRNDLNRMYPTKKQRK
jgi:tetratricopeptide (TPR) repeat protein